MQKRQAPQNKALPFVLDRLYLCLRKQLFRSSQLDRRTENLHGLLEFLERREGRRETDVAVVRVLAVGVRCASVRQHNARFLTELHHALCAAAQHVDADEVAAVRLVPLPSVRRRSV